MTSAGCVLQSRRAPAGIAMAAALQASFQASHAAYLARLAAGKQPLPPAAVRSVAGGALSFLDYTDDSALARVNAIYLLVVALLYVVIRRRGAGFELRWLMIVRLSRFAALPWPRRRRAFGSLPLPWHVCYGYLLPAATICGGLGGASGGGRSSEFRSVLPAAC